MTVTRSPPCCLSLSDHLLVAGAYSAYFAVSYTQDESEDDEYDGEGEDDEDDEMMDAEEESDDDEAPQGVPLSDTKVSEGAWQEQKC